MALAAVGVDDYPGRSPATAAGGPIFLSITDAGPGRMDSTTHWVDSAPGMVGVGHAHRVHIAADKEASVRAVLAAVPQTVPFLSAEQMRARLDARQKQLRPSGEPVAARGGRAPADTSSKLPIYLGLGALGVAALGGAAWLLLRKKPAAIAPNRRRTSRQMRRNAGAKKPIYCGVFFDESEMAVLRNWFRRETGLELLPNIPKDPHLTSVFKPSLEAVSAMPLGSKVLLTVTGWAADEKGQALVVSGFPSANATPHLTLSTAQGVSPVYSNELLSQGFASAQGPTVEGTVGYFDGAVQFSVPMAQNSLRGPSAGRTSRGRSLISNTREGQRAAQNEAQIKYLLGEDIGRAGLAEEDEAAVESRLFVLGQQMSEAKSRLRRFGVRAIGNAQHLVDEFEQRGGWGSDPRGVLFTVADEFCGSGIPQEFLEEEFGWSQLDPETRAALQAMIEIAGIDAQGYRLAEDATSANADADEAERIAEVLSQGPLVSSVGEAYEDSVWNRLQEATGRASSAKYHRGSVLKQLGERIEANGVAYAIPERRAYPITTAQDAYHATQRLKQGRVKSEEDAKRIIRAIKREHPGVWRDYLAGYPVSKAMTSKRKGLAARRRRTSRRMRSNPGEFAVGDRVVISDTPGRVGVVKGPPVLDKFFGVRFVPVLFEDVANPTKQLEDRLQLAPIVKVPPRPSIEWRVARARDELPSLYAMGWVDAADGIAPMWGSALAKSGDGLTSGADAYRQGYQHIEVRSIR
jgi:hypothetical protein